MPAVLRSTSASSQAKAVSSSQLVPGERRTRTLGLAAESAQTENAQRLPSHLDGSQVIGRLTRASTNLPITVRDDDPPPSLFFDTPGRIDSG